MRRGFQGDGLWGGVEPVRFRVDGETLAGVHHAPPPKAKVRGGLVLVHGFNGSRIEFGHAPELLAAAGFHVLAFDQRGFGESEGERGRTSVERAVADIDAAALELRKLAGRRAPFGVVGHSLGGSYALAAMDRTPHFKAGAVAHPVRRILDELNRFERAAYHLLGRRAMRREEKGKSPGTIPYKVKPRILFEDKAAARLAVEEGLLLPDVNLGNYRAALTMDGAAWAAAVTAPVLCIVSPRDRVVDPEHSREVYEALAGPKGLLEHRGGHSCFRDLDATLVAEALVAWFTNHLE